jgi:hypothetical protein
LRGELDAAGAGEHLRGVGDPEDRRETDPETTDGVTVALGRRAQCGQRLHAGGVQRRAGVRGPQFAVLDGDPQVPRHPRALRGVGSVLRQLDEQPVCVTEQGEVGLGIGVLPEPRRGPPPGGQHPCPQRCGAERIRGSGSTVWGWTLASGGAHSTGVRGSSSSSASS